MPLYDVECQHCGLMAEEYQSMNTPQPTKCTGCERVAAIRVILHAPAIRTDCSFFKGGSESSLPRNDQLRRMYYAAAEKAGISTSGKRYMPELVRPGMAGGIDPEAWVPEMEGASYIKRTLRKRGWSSEGRVEVQPPQREIVETKTPYRPANDIVERCVNQEIAREGLALTPSERRHLKTETAKTLAGKMGE